MLYKRYFGFSFIVFIQNIKYMYLNIRTTAISIRECILLRSINVVIRIKVTGMSIYNLLFNVIERFLSKLSRCFLYSFVCKNQFLSLCELLVKQKSDSNRKGVVGSIGIKTPTIPMPIVIKPIDIKINLMKISIA